MNLNELVKFVDYTTLNSSDTEEEVVQLINKAKSFSANGNKVAGICTFSNYSSLLVHQLEKTGIASVVVAAGFPHSHCPLEEKLISVKYADQLKVDEIDIVISLNDLLTGKYDRVKEELVEIRSIIKYAKLKVILETGLIQSEDMLRKACKVAIESGADFLKTSTGKVNEGATVKKFRIICDEIKKYQVISGEMIGIKAAGGIRTVDEANKYIDIVKEVLGEDYLQPKYFRIGASSLLNELE
jgi:deoxyribose-phosphate aldolase